jgi:hypothetical protein
MSDWLSRAATLPAQLCANAVPQAIDPVTRVSSRVEFVESEFNGTARGLPTSNNRYPHRMLQADSSRSRQHARLTKRDQFVLSHAGLQSIHIGETKMISFKALAAAVLLAATAATPAFAQAPGGALVPGGVSSSDHSLYIKNLQDSGYNPKNDFNPDGTIRAAIQEPGAFAFYYPNLDVLNGGAPTPAAKASPDWPALKGACASAGGGITYCGDR